MHGLANVNILFYYIILYYTILYYIILYYIILYYIILYSTLFLCQYVTSPPHLIDAVLDKMNALTVHPFIKGTTVPTWPGPPRHRGFPITLNDTRSVRLLWTSDRPDAETYT